MLHCCGLQFSPAKKIVLPSKDKLYRCLEFAYCPNCSVPVARLIEQDFNYDIFIKEKRGIKALRMFEKAVSQRKKFLQKVQVSSKSGENFYFGEFKKTKKLDSHNNPIYVQLRKNFNNKTEILNEVITYYSKI